METVIVQTGKSELKRLAREILFRRKPKSESSYRTLKPKNLFHFPKLFEKYTRNSGYEGKFSIRHYKL